MKPIDDGWTLHPQLQNDTFAVARLPLCEVRLMNDANYPWLILVPRIAELRELIDLDTGQQLQLLDEVGRASRALQQRFDPHKLNVAALGNVVAQLHVHVIARREDDVAWPSPVWGKAAPRAYDDEAVRVRIAQLQHDLGA